jgi:S1/P1 Nuclease
MKRIILAAISGVCLFSATQGNAWGKKGHEYVVKIAYSMMDEATRKKVEAAIDDMTPEQAGNWMDDVRSDHRYDYMKPWHYVNVEAGQTYQPSTEPNIINQLDSAISRLEHRDRLSKEEIKKNILVLCHLTGDLHQPLHVGYGVDKGGNTIHVKFVGKEANLHWVWDSEIIDYEHITYADCLGRAGAFDAQTLKRFTAISPETWMNQPRALLGQVYKFENGVIDQQYADRNKTLIEDQLYIAGARLAAVLNHCFKG